MDSSLNLSPATQWLHDLLRYRFLTCKVDIANVLFIHLLWGIEKMYVKTQNAQALNFDHLLNSLVATIKLEVRDEDEPCNLGRVKLQGTDCGEVFYF